MWAASIFLTTGAVNQRRRNSAGGASSLAACAMAIRLVRSRVLDSMNFLIAGAASARYLSGAPEVWRIENSWNSSAPQIMRFEQK